MITGKLYRSGILFLFVFSSVVSAQAAELKFQTMEKYTRILVPITAGANFKTINGSNEVTVRVDRTQVSDLLPPSSWSDSRIAGVSLKSVGIDSLELNIKYKRDGVESFAFLQGGGLVLDFWSDSSAPPTVAAKTSQSKVVALPAKVKGKITTKAAGRTIAQVEKEPSPRKKILPLQLSQDIVQKFSLPMPILSLPQGEGIALPPTNQMEDGWKIEASRSDGSDTEKEFKFALKLYQDKKYGLAVKASEISMAKASGVWLDDFKFLSALAYQKLGQSTNTPSLEDKAEAIYKDLLVKRDSAGNPSLMHRKVRSYFARKEFRNENWLAAIDHLENLLADSQTTKNSPYFQILLAEAYTKVNQPRRAERLYRDLVSKKKTHILAKEAMFRIVNLLALEKNYSRVNDQIVEAIRAYPDYESKRAETLFQAGEANFWLGDYKRAEKFLKRYVEVSSAQTNAALAWVRLGEIAEIARGSLTEAKKAYLNAKNGYPFSRGDLVATVRLARIELHEEKEPEFIINSLQAMLADSSIDEEMKQMAELTLGDYLLKVKAADKAIDLARAGIARSSGLVYESYKKNYIEALFAKMENLAIEKSYAQALALYDKEKKWLDSYGPETSKVLSDIYAGLGLRKTSTQMFEKYLAELRTSGRGIASISHDSIQLAESKGKAGFYSGDYKSALRELPKNTNDIETTVLIAISAQEVGERSLSFQYLDRYFSLKGKEKISDTQLERLGRISFDRARAERDYSLAERDLSKIQQDLDSESELVSFQLAEALWLQKKNQKAVDVYAKALEKFPKSAWAGKANYHIGVALIGMGKREEAVKQLTKVKDSNDGVWSESAKQELDLVNWEKKYSSVLRTLPPSGLGIAN